MRNRQKWRFGKYRLSLESFIVKNYVLNWISSIFLKCWVGVCSDVPCSLGQKQFCSWTWVILGWFCVLQLETPSTVIPVRLVFSSYSLDDDILRVFPLRVYRTTVFFHEHRCYLRLVIATFSFPKKRNLKKKEKKNCNLWVFRPAAFQVSWLGTH